MNDMKYSSECVKKAKSIICNLLNGGEILQVEGDENEVLRKLDLSCGIDYFFSYRNNTVVWGIASRVQKIPAIYKPYNTFTVRKARESGAQTEYEKRKFAIQHGGEYPYLTMQMYVNDDKDCLSLAIAKTTDIMDFCDKGLAFEKKTGEQQIGQAVFLVVDWAKFKNAGSNIKLYQRK